MTINSDYSDDGQTPIVPPNDYIDASAWPLVRVVFPEVVTEAGLDIHFASLRRLADRKEIFVTVVYLGSMRNQTRALRQHAAAHLQAIHQDEGTKYLAGVAHVSDHWLTRASLTVVLSLSPPPYPNRVFKRQDSAEAWVRTQLP